MGEITLGDYAGFLFQEIVRAREMADAYSRQVAARYQADPVLEHFPVPRFRIPKVELTVPVLISRATYRQVSRFTLEPEPMIELVMARVRDVLRQITLRYRPGREPVRDLDPRGVTGERIVLFDKRLRSETDILARASLVALEWRDVLETGVAEAGLADYWPRADTEGALYRTSLETLQHQLDAYTVVDRTELESLLVTPETSVVKDGSSDATVFALKAELVEEGFVVHTVTDPKTGHTTTVVDFD